MARPPRHHPVEAARHAYRVAQEGLNNTRERLERARKDPNILPSRLKTLERRYQMRVDKLREAQVAKEAAEEDWIEYKKARAEAARLATKAREAEAEQLAKNIEAKAEVAKPQTTTSKKTATTAKSE